MIFSVSKSGISIRNSICGSLLCDIPKQSIQLILITNSTVLKIITKTNDNMAIEFGTTEGCPQALQSLAKYQIPFQIVEPDKSSHRLPDINDPRMREYIVRLIFSDEFAGFVDDVDHMCDTLRASIPSSF